MSRCAAPPLLICESRRRLAILLRRFAPRGVWSELRSWTLLEERLRHDPVACIMLAPLPEELAKLLPRLVAARTAWPRSCFAIWLPEQHESWREPFMAVGCQGVGCSYHDLPRLLELARRYRRSQRTMRTAAADPLEVRYPWPA
jgi:hypothetical protein